MKKTHTITWDGQLTGKPQKSPNKFTLDRALYLTKVANAHFRKVKHTVTLIKKEEKDEQTTIQEDSEPS